MDNELKILPKWDNTKISRGTKCFGAWNDQRLDGSNKCRGSFPRGFINWLKQMGWHKGKVCHLCSGGVNDEGSFKVDIRPEMKPDLVADATDTKLPSESFDVVVLDPPYSLELAKKLYGTESYFKGIDAFTKEASRICKKGGLIITLTYQVPKRVKDCDFIAVWGIYTIPSCSYMRCFTVSLKRDAIEEDINRT
jgi:hypothetical protein